MKAFEAAGGFEESDEPCELCGGAQQTDANLLLECERCLRGFHMACLDPPLSAVPEVRRCTAVLLRSAVQLPARRLSYIDQADDSLSSPASGERPDACHLISKDCAMSRHSAC